MSSPKEDAKKKADDAARENEKRAAAEKAAADAAARKANPKATEKEDAKAAASGSAPSASSPEARLPTNAPAPSAARSGKSQTSPNNNVVISDKGFEPKVFEAKVNMPVNWTNEDDTAHSVEYDPAPSGMKGSVAPPSSGEITPDGTYSYTFVVPGEYHYHCGHHKDMKGTIKVSA